MLNWLTTLLVLMLLTQVLHIEVPRQLIEICNKRNHECDCRYPKFLGILSLRKVGCASSAAWAVSRRDGSKAYPRP
ncbi:hypothetical protein C8R48DRAFT_683001 [Suillus tomentosus]|nr:hypothetical protein C8R48DRAFT_683001 [Suillus tomentosus]